MQKRLFEIVEYQQVVRHASHNSRTKCGKIVHDGEPCDDTHEFTGAQGQQDSATHVIISNEARDILTHRQNPSSRQEALCWDDIPVYLF